MKRVGKVSGTVRLSGKDLTELREQRYQLDRGRCQWRKGKPDACGKWLPLHGDLMVRAHLAHTKSHGAGGGDTLSNTRILCFHHHIEAQHMKGLKG